MDVEPHRYAWTSDLVAADDTVRGRALDRHAALLWPGRGWGLTGTLVDPVGAFLAGQAFAPFAVLFLQWEQRHPQDWRAHWDRSPWTAKSAVLRRFAAAGESAGVEEALVELVVAAVGRRHRCEDSGYWLLARRLDGPVLRGRLGRASGLRAAFLLWLLDHPDERVGAATWRRWLRTIGQPVTEPVPAAELAALTPVKAARLLAQLDAAALATVLDGLDSVAAARILSHTDPAVRAPAVGLMNVRFAARVLKALPEVDAAALLAAMPPGVAGARFPGKVGPRLVRRLAFGVALDRLSAAPPALCGRLLAGVPVAAAIGFLSAMDRASAAAALAAMEWPAARRVFPAVPEELFAEVLAHLAPRDTARIHWQYEKMRFMADG